MTVHAIDVYTATNIDFNTVTTAVQDWLANHQRALTEQDISMTQSNTRLDGTGTDFYHGLFRFDMDAETRDELQTALENNITQLDWSIIRYHVCDHDEGDRGGCAWDAPIYNPDQATVPDDVEALL